VLNPAIACALQREDGFVEVLQQPVEQQEVAAALDNLYTLGGGGGALVARR